MKGRVVQVDVQGQKYSVRSELEPAYIAEIANYVDQKMQLAASQLTTADATRVAVIAALNLADELFRARAAGAGVEQQVLDRTAAIERMVDAALGLAVTEARIVNG
ncbi:MAG: cell division protein ZapA [Acidobacteria bacterium]|nr:MAG: cell division protein ZapA [Acidobacteriota bacterium]